MTTTKKKIVKNFVTKSTKEQREHWHWQQVQTHKNLAKQEPSRTIIRNF
jgi:hypothetical protein